MATPFLPMAEGSAARYFNAVMRGRVFFACNSVVTVNTVIHATATGLILSNPVTSAVNLVILQVCVAIASAPAAQSNLALCGTLLTTAEAATTHTTPLVVKPALIGSGLLTGATKADSSATVPTPLPLRAIGGGPVGAVTLNTAYICDNVDGAIIMAPGTVISLQAITTAISTMSYILWEEVPA